MRYREHLGEVVECDVLPLFREFFALRESLGPDTGAALTDLQIQLSALLDDDR